MMKSVIFEKMVKIYLGIRLSSQDIASRMATDPHLFWFFVLSTFLSHK